MKGGSSQRFDCTQTADTVGRCHRHVQSHSFTVQIAMNNVWGSPGHLFYDVLRTRKIPTLVAESFMSMSIFLLVSCFVESDAAMVCFGWPFNAFSILPRKCGAENHERGTFFSLSNSERIWPLYRKRIHDNPWRFSGRWPDPGVVKYPWSHGTSFSKGNCSERFCFAESAKQSNLLTF